MAKKSGGKNDRTGREERAERLGAALRANLSRRKAQVRGRKAEKQAKNED